MLRKTTLLIICLASLSFAQSTALIVTSAASNSTTLTVGSLGSAFGMNLAAAQATAPSAPWPVTLGGVTVQVRDSANVSHAAGILFVSPTQVNFQVPDGTALGVASILVNSGGITFSGQALIATAAPSLFAIDSSGIAAATAIRIVIPTQMQSPVPVFICADPGAGCNLVGIDPGIDAPVYISFYGTGIGNGPATVNFGATAASATYAGPQGQFPGLDQVNVPLPLSLHGAGVVDVTVTVNGVTSNAVKIRVL
jgi:uncharacterized protein (TIGR03437 family)